MGLSEQDVVVCCGCRGRPGALAWGASTAVRASEEAEDIWADAQALRKKLS